jgi:hypothetical protein
MKFEVKMLAGAKFKIVILDDDWSFLNVINYYLKQKFDNNVRIKTFNKSPDFISYIRDFCFLPDNPNDILCSFYSLQSTENNIKKTLYDLSYLSAVIVVDQNLRGEKQSGITLSREIREYFPASYIAMLTSNLTSDKAVMLHNENLIDLFVHKDSHDSIEYLFTRLWGQITFKQKDFEYNAEDVFDWESIITEDRYITAKLHLLNSLSYDSFLTINSAGDIAVLKEDKTINTYWYDLNKDAFNSYD